MQHFKTKSFLLSTSLALVALQGCGGSETISSLPTVPLDAPVQASADGVFTLAAPVGPVAAAAQLQLTIVSSQALPDSIEIQEAVFVPLPLDLGQGRVYVPQFDSALTPLQAFNQIRLAGVTEVSVIETDITTSSDNTQLIFQGDATSVSFDDFVLVRALSTLPPNLRTPEAIAQQANTLFPAGNFTPEALDPVPDELNTDFVSGGTVPAPDLIDAAVVYAATFIPANQRTAENLAAVVNALLPGTNLQPGDIQAIPGVALPGGIAIAPPLNQPAGSFQISVLANIDTPSFQVGAAQFIQLPASVFPGFTSYAAEPNSTLINVEVNQLNIPNVDASTCIIVHQPGQDPLDPGNQISLAASCDLSNVIPGSGVADDLIGTGGADILNALEGDDTIDGLAGSDLIIAGPGSDTIVYTEGQLGSGPDQLADWAVEDDSFLLDAADFGVERGLSFINDVAANLPASGNNVIVLQDTDDGVSDVFNARAAARLIGNAVTTAEPGFFIYWNSALQVNRLVFSPDLSDGEATFNVLAAINTLEGQAAIDALPTFAAENFAFQGETITGSVNADTLTGFGGNDTIDALGGNDTIDGQGGADQIVTGSGSDAVVYTPIQRGSGPDQLSDWAIDQDLFQLDADGFGVAGSLSFVNDVAANLPTGGVNVIVLQDIDDGVSTVFNARAAARLIGAQITQPGPGFFIYWNSALTVNRLVFSTDLSDGDAPISVLSAITTVDGQDAIDDLPVFSAGNFSF